MCPNLIVTYAKSNDSSIDSNDLSLLCKIFQNNTLSVNQDEVRNACYTMLNYSLRVVEDGLFAKSVY